MAFAVTSALERRLDRTAGVAKSLHDKIYLPWEGTHQTISVVERPPVQEYLEVSFKLCDKFTAVRMSDVLRTAHLFNKSRCP